MKRVAIILVNGNNAKDTIAWLIILESLDTTGCSVLLMVVDNASTDIQFTLIKVNFNH